MSQIISALLSPAMGIAISPMPIVGLILILLSTKARSNSLFYSVGWIAGNAAAFLVALFAIGASMTDRSGPSTIARIVFACLAVLMFVVAVRDFLSRPKEGEKPRTPKWFERITNIGPGPATGFGFFLSALNPKNLLLAISAGASVGAIAGIDASGEIWATVLFLLISCSTILVPTIAFQIAGERLEGALNSARVWLIQNNSVVMAVLFLFIGLSLVNKALG